MAVGDVVTVEPFEPGQMVRVTGTSKGKGYAGTIKRHNFKSGPKSHGSHNIRGPGSIGAAAYPARVFKGMRMSGHMGARRSRSAASRSSTATPSATCCSCAARSPAASTAS